MKNNNTIPKPINEPIKAYAPGSPEKTSLKNCIQDLKSKTIEVPLIIGGEEIKSNNLSEMYVPHDHQHVLGNYHKAGLKEVNMAIEASLDAWKNWSKTSIEERAKIFLKAADLLAWPWRDTVKAASMLYMSKNV